VHSRRAIRDTGGYETDRLRVHWSRLPSNPPTWCERLHQPHGIRGSTSRL